MIAGGGYLVLLLVGPQELRPSATVFIIALFAIATAITTHHWLNDMGQSRTSALFWSSITGIITYVILVFAKGKLSFYSATLLAIPCTGFLASAIYTVGYLPLIKKNAPRTSILLTALGFSIALESWLLIACGSQQLVFPPDVLPQELIVKPLSTHMSIWPAVMKSGIVTFPGAIVLPFYDVLIIVIFIVVAFALTIFFKFNKVADAIIATADNRLAARACGIPVERIHGYAFFIGGMIASIGGTFYILRSKSLDPTAGFTPGIIAFLACVLGGIGSLRGSIAGAFFVSLIYSLAPAIPLSEWATQLLPENVIKWLPSLNMGDWSYGTIYVIMIVTILFKPKGLFVK
jgi:branched-chain amino acid transport system permease protein